MKVYVILNASDSTDRLREIKTLQDVARLVLNINLLCFEDRKSAERFIKILDGQFTDGMVIHEIDVEVEE
jgi:hypothetical protein